LSIRPIVRAEPAVTVTVWLLAFDPAPLAAVRVTVYVPAVPKACVGFCDALVVPSPKFHDQVVGDPVDASVNCTL
jgi:hypothetical protein